MATSGCKEKKNRLLPFSWGIRVRRGTAPIVRSDESANAVLSSVTPVMSSLSAIYQVFVDRFDPGGDPPAAPERAAEEGTVRRPFGAPPDRPPTGRDLQGGTLHGVAARLEHVAALADAVYLTPITRAPSNHKYDVADFEAIDEHFGGEAGLAALVAGARRRGLQLFVDAVFNHVGDRHPWAGEAARLRGTGWRGYDHLRELDLAAPAVRAALVGPGGVVERLVARGADGLRLDCANDLGRAFCGEVAAAIARAGGTGGAIGEVMAWPAGLVGDGGLDGAMSYWLRAALLGALADEAEIGPAARALDRFAEALPPAALQRSWTVLSSHDTPRLSDAVGFDERRARLLLALQFAYPGVPLLYYGEEVGLSGGADPGCRGAMVWDEARWDLGRLAFVRALVGLRRAHPALRAGRYVPLPVAPPALAFARAAEAPGGTIVCVANLSERPIRARVLLPLEGFYDALPAEDLLSPGGERAAVEQGAVVVGLPPYGVRWLQGRDDHASGYRFWKT